MDNTSTPPEGLDEFLAQPEDAPIVEPMADPTTQGIEPEGLDAFIAPEMLQEKYGSPSQQALAGLEGVAKGIAGPLATGAELASGMTTPEAIRGRAEANPWTHGIAEATGFVGSAAIPFGQARVLGKAAEAVGLASKATGSFVNKVGQDALKGAFETALFQGGEEIHKAFVADPNQTSDTAIADIGLAGVMGGVFGGALGAGLRAMRPGVDTIAETAPKFVSEVDGPALEAGDLRTTVKHSDLFKPAEKDNLLSGLDFGKQKADAPEILAAGKELGAPVMEGMTSSNYYVQKGDNLLVSGAPTVSGSKRHALYQQGYEIADGAVQGVLGEGSHLSKAQVGNAAAEALTAELEKQYTPIRAMYDEVEPGLKQAFLGADATDNLVKELKLIPELRLSPSSPEGQLVRRVVNDASNLQTVNDVKIYKGTLSSILKNPTGDPGQKRIASILLDKMNSLIDSSITDPVVKATLKEAGAQYGPLMKKIGTLSEILGKGKVHGVEDAFNFIRGLDPETVTNRLFNKNSSKDLAWFAKNFPEQMELMKDYQKGVLRQQASTTGTLSPKVLFNKINKLEPEIQNILFTKPELKTLKSAETYLRAFPKDFNPSHTADVAAFRDMFQHGITGAISANARDKAIEMFIKHAGHMPEVQNANSLAKATVNGWNIATKGVKAIFKPEAAMPASIAASIPARDKLKKLVEEYTLNPKKMLQIGDNNPIPHYQTAFAATAANAVTYLNSMKPNTDKKSPLDSETKPSSDAVAKYNRALDLAQNPALILKSIKEGNVRPQDLLTVKTIYPGYYKQLQDKLTGEMMEAVHKKVIIPYKTRIGLSMFMAQPLDSTLQPQAIQSAQLVFAPKENPGQPGANPAGVKRGTASLSKVANQYKTPGQAAEEDQSKR